MCNNTFWPIMLYSIKCNENMFYVYGDKALHGYVYFWKLLLLSKFGPTHAAGYTSRVTNDTITCGMTNTHPLTTFVPKHNTDDIPITRIYRYNVLSIWSVVVETMTVSWRQHGQMSSTLSHAGTLWDQTVRYTVCGSADQKKPLPPRPPRCPPPLVRAVARGTAILSRRSNRQALAETRARTNVQLPRDGHRRRSLVWGEEGETPPSEARTPHGDAVAGVGRRRHCCSYANNSCESAAATRTPAQTVAEDSTTNGPGVATDVFAGKSNTASARASVIFVLRSAFYGFTFRLEHDFTRSDTVYNDVDSTLTVVGCMLDVCTARCRNSDMVRRLYRIYSRILFVECDRYRKRHFVLVEHGRLRTLWRQE